MGAVTWLKIYAENVGIGSETEQVERTALALLTLLTLFTLIHAARSR